MKGWKRANDPPEEIRRCVLLAAPHTSNWDFVYTLAFGFDLGIKFKVAIKHFWTRFPLGLLIKPLGGIGIRRDKERIENQSQAELMAELFERYDDLTLTIAPEGTRRLRTKWKKGYYYVALKAKVPIVPVFLDYGNRKLIFSDPIFPTDDKMFTLRRVKQFYEELEGTAFDPSNFSTDQEVFLP